MREAPPELELTIRDIIDELRGYSASYRAFWKFQDDKNWLWDLCLETLSDPKALDHIIFSNNFLQEPPVRVFLVLNPDIQEMTLQEKKFLGTFWAYVFKNIFGHTEQRQILINHVQVRAATYFYGGPKNIKIME